MAVKPGGKAGTIREQIIEDKMLGLTFQFAVVEGSSAPFRLRIFGNIPYGNREILFDADGAEAGGGTLLTGECRPTWLQEVKG